MRIDGPALMLAPDTAQNLGLAFHELATNASKYGALASDTGELDGQLEPHRRTRCASSGASSGGPPVAQPERQGFGRVLLERLVGATLNGSVTLDFRPEGLVCEIVFPEAPPRGGKRRGVRAAADHCPESLNSAFSISFASRLRASDSPSACCRRMSSVCQVLRPPSLSSRLSVESEISLDGEQNPANLVTSGTIIPSLVAAGHRPGLTHFPVTALRPSVT